MRIEVNAGGRQVIVDCSDSNLTPRDVLIDALEAWRATAGVQPPQQYGFGVVAASPANDRPASSAARRGMEVVE